MRSIQLLMLALVATAARADLVTNFDGSIVGALSDR